MIEMAMCSLMEKRPGFSDHCLPKSVTDRVGKPHSIALASG